MQKEDILKENQFINFATELYDMKVMKEIVSDPDNYFVSYKKKGLFGKEEVRHLIKEPNYYNNLKTFIENQLHEDSDTPLSFRIIWSFCDFVRWAEKTIFFENDLASRVIVDSVMGAGVINDDPRVIVFQCSSAVTIKLELKKMKIEHHSVLDLDNTFGKSEVITLEVIRNYGKKMKSKYVIVDGNVEYKDISDIYLMNTVNKIVKDGITNTFRQVLFYIENGVPFTDFNTSDDTQIKKFISSHFS